MEALPVILTLVALYVAIPFLRCFFKRLSCLCRIRAVCRRMGHELRGTHPLWFLGSRYGKSCDCFISTASGVFAVKLFGALRGLKALVFSGYGRYFFRPLNDFPLFRLDFFDVGHHRMPEYDFSRRLHPEWRGQPVRRFLLINPIPGEIRLQPASGSETVSGPGDVINGMEIASLSHLLRLLENAG